MNWTSLKWIKLRILLISLGFVLYLGLVLLRSYELHISENARVHNLAAKQYRASLPVAPKRGTVYDRNNKALAIDVEVMSVAVHPHQITDAEAVVEAVSSATGVLSDKVRLKIASGKKFEWIVRRIPASAGEALGKKKIKGVVVVSEYRRFYPNKEIAGHLLGAVGYDAKALGGIELAFDQFLKSSAGHFFAERDARGRLYTPLENQDINHDVHLTLDLNLQFITEKYLWENAEKYRVKSGFAIVADPQTGEILSMANYPSFNPNAYWEYSQESWKNHAVIDTFEPGSTFKPVLAAAALDSGRISPKDRFFCENGQYRIGGRVIHDHNSYGLLTLSDIIQVSSNIGITKTAQKLGKIPFYDFMVRAGFGRTTGLNLPGETEGHLVPVKMWSDIEQSNMAFGQGLSVNAMQMVRAYSAFANNGVRMRPYIISKVVSSRGEVILENHPIAEGQVMSGKSAEELTGMLERVVGKGGTGWLAKPEGYNTAGKTGTAQKVNASTKTYDPHNFVGSFIGYVPSRDPKYIIYVAYDSPQGQHYGGVIAAPVFKNIAEEALAYAGVLPQMERLASQLHP